MSKIYLHGNEIHTLEKIARKSKMDDWFSIDENNELEYDDLYDLVDGATECDVEDLNHTEMLDIINLLNRLLKDERK